MAERDWSTPPDLAELTPEMAVDYKLVGRLLMQAMPASTAAEQPVCPGDKVLVLRGSATHRNTGAVKLLVWMAYVLNQNARTKKFRVVFEENSSGLFSPQEVLPAPIPDIFLVRHNLKTDGEVSEDDIDDEAAAQSGDEEDDPRPKKRSFGATPFDAGTVGRLLLESWKECPDNQREGLIQTNVKKRQDYLDVLAALNVPIIVKKKTSPICINFCSQHCAVEMLR